MFDPISISMMVGLVAGFIGVAIAVYLQLIVVRTVKPEYVMLFLTFGAALILINQAFILDGYPFSEWYPLLGNVTLLVGEVFAFKLAYGEVAESWEEFQSNIVEEVLVGGKDD